jgi:hypothetical protein
MYVHKFICVNITLFSEAYEKFYVRISEILKPSLSWKICEDLSGF